MVLQALWSFASALLLTIAVEAPVAFLLGLRTWHEQAILLLINVITNPLLNLLINALAFSGAYVVKSPFDAVLITLEIIVIAAEALLLKTALRRSLARAAVISLAANTASWLAGALILWR